MSGPGPAGIYLVEIKYPNGDAARKVVVADDAKHAAEVAGADAADQVGRIGDYLPSLAANRMIVERTIAYEYMPAHRTGMGRTLRELRAAGVI